MFGFFCLFFFWFVEFLIANEEINPRTGVGFSCVWISLYVYCIRFSLSWRFGLVKLHSLASCFFSTLSLYLQINWSVMWFILKMITSSTCSLVSKAKQWMPDKKKRNYWKTTSKNYIRFPHPQRHIQKISKLNKNEFRVNLTAPHSQ